MTSAEQDAPVPDHKGRHRRRRTPGQLALIALITMCVIGLVALTALAWHARAAGGSTAGAPTAFAPTKAPLVQVHTEASTWTAGSAVAGDTITPGLWSTDGGARCRWTRNEGASWETAGTPTQKITIHLGNGATFETYDCAPWQLYRAD